MHNPQMTNEQIIDYLMNDIPNMIAEREPLDINDPFGDYLEGIISRSQTILRMMGVPEDKIPSDGSC
jgi:hypothetical protein